MFQTILSKYHSFSAAQKRVVLFCGVLLLGMLAAMITMFVNLYLARDYYPQVTFLFDPRYRYSDFYDVVSFLRRGLDIYSQPGPNYFPFFMILLLPLNYVNATWALWGMIGLFIAFYIIITYHLMPAMPYKAVWTAIFTFCSYPLWFALNRGNVEMLLFIVCGLFILFYQKGWFKTAGILLALAINMKLYPAVFLILFAADKKYKDLLYTVCLTGLLFGIGCWLSGAGENLQNNLEFFALHHQQRPFGLQFSHSLMNLIRIPAFISLEGGNPQTWGEFTLFSKECAWGYMLFMFALFSFICLYVLFISKSLWKNVLLLTLAEISFPFVSSDYTLIHLIFPVLLFFNARGSGTQTTLCILLALLFIPMNWWAHTYYMSYYAMVLNAGSLLRPVIIVWILAMLVQDFSVNKLKASARALVDSFKKNFTAL